MKIKLSLRMLLLASFISLGLLLIVAYSVVSRENFIRGLDAITATNMEDAANTFISIANSNELENGKEFSGYFISTDWNTMPAYVHNAFVSAPTAEAILLKADDGGFLQHPTRIVFLMLYQRDNARLYISKEMVPPDSLSVVASNTQQQIQAFQRIVTLSVLLCVILIAWLLLRHVSRPMSRLRQWTHSLNGDNLSQIPPDFSYPELNEMAELIRSSLSSVQQAVEREKRFLRYASHELRTPISTIRNNVELQRKLSLKKEITQAEQAVLDRIDRASLTMQHLTETLLWLNHEPDTRLQRQSVNLAELIRELSEDMSYLLTGKPVSVQLDGDDTCCELPLTPARIVIGNLIRNAFQHSWQGEVRIQQKGTEICIENPAGDAGDDQPTINATAGYGLGLQLTEQLTCQLGWRYQHQLTNGCYQVLLSVSGREDGALVSPAPSN